MKFLKSRSTIALLSTIIISIFIIHIGIWFVLSSDRASNVFGNASDWHQMKEVIRLKDYLVCIPKSATSIYYWKLQRAACTGGTYSVSEKGFLDWASDMNFKVKSTAKIQDMPNAIPIYYADKPTYYQPLSHNELYIEDEIKCGRSTKIFQACYDKDTGKGYIWGLKISEE
jgi:hypothetical protein